MRDIEGTRLFSDFEKYTQSVKNSLFKNDEEKKLDQKTHSLELLERLNRLELSREDWEEVKKLKGLKVERVSSGENFLTFEPFNLSTHFAFYENAQARDEVFFNNLIALMNEHAAKTSLLVAGGFHTESLIQKFRKQGISYILLTPQIDSIPENSHYREHMKGDVSWKDYYQVENGKVDLYKAFVRGTRDKLLNVGAQFIAPNPLSEEQGVMNHAPTLLKSWRDQIIRDLAQREKITKVQEYTSFIDETAFKTQAQQALPEWRVKLEKFIEGLRRLDSQGQLTEQNILNLFPLPAGQAGASGGKPSTHASPDYAAAVPGSLLDVSYFPAGTIKGWDGAALMPFAEEPSTLSSAPSATAGRSEARRADRSEARALGPQPDKLRAEARDIKKWLIRLGIPAALISTIVGGYYLFTSQKPPAEEGKKAPVEVVRPEPRKQVEEAPKKVRPAIVRKAKDPSGLLSWMTLEENKGDGEIVALKKEGQRTVLELRPERGWRMLRALTPDLDKEPIINIEYTGGGRFYLELLELDAPLAGDKFLGGKPKIGITLPPTEGKTNKVKVDLSGKLLKRRGTQLTNRADQLIISDPADFEKDTIKITSIRFSPKQIPADAQKTEKPNLFYAIEKSSSIWESLVIYEEGKEGVERHVIQTITQGIKEEILPTVFVSPDGEYIVYETKETSFGQLYSFITVQEIHGERRKGLYEEGLKSAHFTEDGRVEIETKTGRLTVDLDMDLTSPRSEARQASRPLASELVPSRSSSRTARGEARENIAAQYNRDQDLIQPDSSNGDETEADRLSEKLAKEVIKSAMGSYIPVNDNDFEWQMFGSLMGPRDAFVLRELLLRGTKAAATAALEFNHYGNVADATGEALIRFLYDHSALSDHPHSKVPRSEARAEKSEKEDKKLAREITKKLLKRDPSFLPEHLRLTLLGHDLGRSSFILKEVFSGYGISLSLESLSQNPRASRLLSLIGEELKSQKEDKGHSNYLIAFLLGGLLFGSIAFFGAYERGRRIEIEIETKRIEEKNTQLEQQMLEEAEKFKKIMKERIEYWVAILEDPTADNNRKELAEQALRKIREQTEGPLREQIDKAIQEFKSSSDKKAVNSETQQKQGKYMRLDPMGRQEFIKEDLTDQSGHLRGYQSKDLQLPKDPLPKELENRLRSYGIRVEILEEPHRFESQEIKKEIEKLEDFIKQLEGEEERKKVQKLINKLASNNISASRSEARSTPSAEIFFGGLRSGRGFQPEQGAVAPRRRSEARLASVEIVNIFKGDEVTGNNLRDITRTIVTVGVAIFVPELYAAAEDATREEDIATGANTKNYFDAIRAIDKPIVIEYNVAEQDLIRMGGNARSEIRNLFQAIHDASATNANIIGRLNVPDRARSELRLADHNQKDAVKLEKMGSNVTIYNSGLQGYANYVTGPAAITVTDTSNVKSPTLFPDKYVDGQEIYQSAAGAVTAPKIYAFALVSAAESISERTFKGLVPVHTDGYRIKSKYDLNAMGPLVEAMAQYRAELRTKVAA